MGLASISNPHEALQLCVFDLKRGQQEGQELDKILFFYPADSPLSTQLSVIGLSEGLITFTRMFSPEAACEVIEAQRHSHVFYEAEPDIWMVMVVEKSKEAETIWRTDALREVLVEVHSLFLMFYGSIRAMLEKEPGGGFTRSALYTFTLDYLTDIFSGKKLQLPSFRDCLNERRTVQMLTVGREAAIEVQTLVRTLESCAGTTNSFSLVLFRDLLVSTTLPPEDTLNLFTYAVLRLTPHTLSSGASSWSYLRKGYSSSQVAAGSTPTNSTSVPEQLHGSRDISSESEDNKYQIVRPLKADRWSKGKDGFLNSGLATPTVWLKHTDERMHLCAYQYKNLTVITLIPVNSILDGEQGVSEVKQKLLENALKIQKVEEKLSKGWGGENAYHVSGYRYLLVDGNRATSRASPPGKVTTLTKESLLAINKLREEVDLEKRQIRRNHTTPDKDLEMCIRAKNNAWAIARITGGEELYMVLEKADEKLLHATEAVEKFSDRYCNGAFSLD